ncbi:MAG TPA: helix-turn-helix domain-containing protein [Rhizorhapis sp.]|nr:helix-turn-helix domain-containing protein [Rhizorhapis sp.]
MSIEEYEGALGAFFGNFLVDRSSCETTYAAKVEPHRHGPFDACEVVVRGIDGSHRAINEKWSEAAFLLVSYEGALEVEHHGTTSLLTPRGMMLIDVQNPCSVRPRGRSRTISYALDRKAIAACGSSQTLYGTTIPAIGRGKMLFPCLQGLGAVEGWTDLDKELASELLGEMIDAALGTRSLSKAARKGPSLSEIRKWVEAHINCDQLTPDSLAQNFAMSRRSMFRLFAAYGVTPRQWILDVRLEMARRKLVEQPLRSGWISQVAYDVGFVDSSHFSRCFKRKFGVAPKDIRI